MWTRDNEYDAKLVGTRADGTNIEQGTKSLSDFQWMVMKQLFTDSDTQGIAYQWLTHLFIEKEAKLELGLALTARMTLIEKSRKVTPIGQLISRRYVEEARTGNLIYVFERFDCAEFEQANAWLQAYLKKLARAAAFAGTLFDLMHTEEAFDKRQKCFILDREKLKLYAKITDCNKDIILNGKPENHNSAIYLHPKTKKELILKPTVQSYQEFYAVVITHPHPLTLLEVLALQEKGLTLPSA